jgi:glyoxylase-like metal-dependent hydrolase (beta-lactamase superfamily II)
MAPQATIWAGELDAPQITMPRAIQTVVDGDEVFGLQIIGTPGHTLGHISVFDPVASAVVTGDALFNVGGVIGGSPPAFTADMALADESVRKLGAMSFQRALVAHGLPIESGASAAIAQFAATLQAPPPAEPAPVTPPAPQPAAPPAPQPAPAAPQPAAPPASSSPAGQAPGVQAPGVQMPR